MNGNLKRRIERLEQAVRASGCDDPRAATYPNSWVELVLRAHMSDEKWQEFLWGRRSKPCPKFWDWIDQQRERSRTDRVENRSEEL